MYRVNPKISKTLKKSTNDESNKSKSGDILKGDNQENSSFSENKAR